MSFKSNVGKPRVEPLPQQCGMINPHHPDCDCASCEMHLDVQCLEPVVGRVADCHVNVCGACAVLMEREEWPIRYLASTRFVIVHPEMGVYLGSALGLGFWSKWDAVGQPAAVTFASRAEAEQTMLSWDGGRPTAAKTWPVLPDDGTYASVSACVAAGLEVWDPDPSEAPRR